MDPQPVTAQIGYAFPVDHVAECLSDADILERFHLGRVHPEGLLAVLEQDDREPVLCQGRQDFCIQGVHAVDVADHQGHHRRVLVRQDHKLAGLHMRLAFLVPVVLPRLQDKLLAGFIGFDIVRSRSDRRIIGFSSKLFDQRMIRDSEILGRQFENEQRVGCLQVNHNLIVTGRFIAVHQSEQSGLVLGQDIPCRNHVCGREGITVGKCYVVPEVECPGKAVLRHAVIAGKVRADFVIVASVLYKQIVIDLVVKRCASGIGPGIVDRNVRIGPVAEYRSGNDAFRLFGLSRRHTVFLCLSVQRDRLQDLLLGTGSFGRGLTCRNCCRHADGKNHGHCCRKNAFYCLISHIYLLTAALL